MCSVCKWVDVFPPCFYWWQFYTRKDYSQFIIYTLDDQNSLENAFLNQLSLQTEPLQTNFQALKEKRDKCPGQMFSSVCFQQEATLFFTNIQDINELAGFCSLFHLVFHLLNPSTPMGYAEISRFTSPRVSFDGMKTFLKHTKKEVHCLCYYVEIN